jgi:hypothetical protein
MRMVWQAFVPLPHVVSHLTKTPHLLPSDR